MEEIYTSNPPGVRNELKQKRVFIAGAGGLGGNVAMMLARAGVQHIIIADYDTIEPANLNRQFFFEDQIGQVKVEALKTNLQRINSQLTIQTINDRLTSDNFGTYIPADVDMIFECFDKAEAKADLANFAIKERSSVPCITVSGLAGLGLIENITFRKKMNNLYMIGDGISEMNEQNGTIASRVIAAASMQAHFGLRLLLGII